MTRGDLIAFLRNHKLCVQSSLHASGAPQAAVVGYAVSDDLEVVFDTVTTSRKYQNLTRDPRCSIVVWSEAITVQLEGIADEPTADDLDRLRTCYFGAYPDGRERLRDWPTLTYVRVRPRWARYSDFATNTIVELDAGQLA
ncbi:MAG: pyridoxamine 5'-phosphate oxidase family protein [Deltaproteobacteria bacterium]|nr:pyridoxamine 5'-phosphate oxidase family protein [Deltaproteobacteria bacterium]